MKPITLAILFAPLGLGACATLFGAASPFAFDRKGELVEFNYAWSAEASRQPALVRRLRRDLEAAFASTTAAAEADRAAAKASGRLFKGHRYTRRWTTAGQSARLLSLDGRLTASTGAAASHRADGLLWDRATRTAIAVDQLFVAAGSAAQLVRTPGCALLARRDAAASCASPGAVAMLPADDNDNGRFDHFRLVAPTPARGADATVVNVAVSAALLATLKPAYRAGFEVAQPQ
jgi:hypothetical protein